MTEDTILSKLDCSAKLFKSKLTKQDIDYIYSLCVSITQEDTKTKTLGKYIACLKLGIREDKQCTVCNERIPYRDFKTYIKQSFCCINCREKHRGIINLNANNALKNNREAVLKRKSTLHKMYGVTNSMQLDAVKSIRKQRCFEQHGVEHTSQLITVKQKVKQTNLNRYGVECTLLTSKEKNSEQKRSKKFDTLQQLTNIAPIFKKEEYYGIFHGNCKKFYPFICNICKREFSAHLGSWNTNLDSCPYCSGESNKYEDFLGEFLVSINVPYERNNRKILQGKEIDFFLSHKNIAIEVDGLYYHSTKFIKRSDYHLAKTNMCKQQGISLIHVFGDEILFNIKSLKNRLRSVLGKNKHTVYGRKCEVYPITSAVKSKFLKKYHIQGDCNSSINLGLFYKKRLLSVMTFGKKRVSTGHKGIDGEFELYRFCSIYNFNILGGASKLLSYFEKYYQPTEIISFCDLRYTSTLKRNLYESLGMKLCKQTLPNYWIVRGNKREHRFSYRKSVLHKKLSLFDPLLSETQNLEQNNIFKIYDCGNLLYRKTYTRVKAISIS